MTLASISKARKLLVLIVLLTAMAFGLVFNHCTANAAVTDEEIEKLINQSKEALLAGQPEISLALCKKVVALKPELADGQICLGLAFLGIEKYDEALESFQMAVKLEPAYLDGYIGQAIVYNELRQFEKSVLFYEKAVKIEQNDANIYKELGIVYRRLNRLDEARTACQKAAELKPDPLSYFCLCEVNVLLENYRLAVDSCEHAAMMFETQYREHLVDALAYLSIAYSKLGRRNEEAEAYKKVMELGLNNGTVYFLLALAYFDLEEYDKVIEVCNNGLNRGFRKKDLSKLKGQALTLVGKYDEAVEVFLTALEQNPTDTGILHFLGDAYKQLGESDKAKNVWLMTTNIQPSEQQDYDNIANAYRQLKRYDEAINVYKQAFALYPNDHSIPSSVGHLYMEMKDYENAIAEFRLAKQLKWDDEFVYRNLARALSSAGKHNEAIETLLTTLEKNPTDTDALDLLGDTYEQVGELDKAKNIWLKIIALEPHDAQGYNHLAKAYEKLSCNDEAVIAYKKAISLNPNYHHYHSFLGHLYMEMKEYEKAITEFQLAKQLSKDGSFANSNLGEAFFFIGRYEEAVEAFLSAFEKDPTDTLSLHWLAVTYKQMGKRDKAKDTWQKLTEMQPSDEHDYINQAHAFNNLKHTDEAVIAYKKAISLNPNYHHYHSFLGHLYMEMKEYEKAITEFQLAKQLHKNKSNYYEDLSSAYLALKIYDQSIAVLKEAISLKLDNHETYFRLAVVYAKANQWDNAKEALQKALTKKPDAMEELESVCLNWANLGRFSDCVKPIENVLGICRKNKDQLCEADAIFQNGFINHINMEQLSAEKNFMTALQIYQKLEAKNKQIKVLTALANIYQMQSKPDKMRAALESKLALAKELKNSYAIIETLTELADKAGNDNEMKNYALQAINLAKEHDMEESVAVHLAYGIMALLSFKNKDDTSMWQFAEKFERIAEASDNTFFKIRHEQLMGAGLLTIGDYEKAANRFRKMYELASEINYLPIQSSALCVLGGTNIKLGKTSEAKDNLIMCTEGSEEVRAKLESPRFKQMFTTYLEGPYEALIGLLVKSGEIENAFNRAERAKARALLDTLGARFDPQQSARSKVLRLRSLQAMILALEEKLQKSPRQIDPREDLKSRSIERDLETAKNEYALLLEEIKRDNPEEYSLLSVSASSLKEVMSFLDPETTLIEYFITEDQTYVWVVDKSGFKFVQIDVKKEELEKRVNGYRERIATFDPDYRDDAVALYDLLLNPVMPHVKNKRLIIVPHGALNHLPFHALIVPRMGEGTKKGRFLIEDYDVSYTPSASVLRFIYEKRKPLTGKILALGNPYLDEKELELPYAEEEVKRIKSAYPQTSVFLQRQATKTRVQNSASSYNAIHFATHAELSPDSPMSSSIRLAKEGSNDGNLRVHEVFGLDLKNTSMVTLSGCETGLGKSAGGDEFVGLSRAFIYAGAPTIVASLWKVNDQSTAELMTLFYQNLKTGTKAQALRRAQIEMIKGEVGAGIVRGVGGITTAKKAQTVPVKEAARTVDGSHPYFWAPFILIGDWK